MKGPLPKLGTKLTSAWPPLMSGAEGQADIEPSTIKVCF